ncbi:MAG: hypothetical protein ACFE8E_05755 [Candidatus Hodarchaeota archaeon]
MTSEWSILCKLGGFVNSNPELLSTYPSLEIPLRESNEILSKCFPIGAKPGDFIVDKYKKYNVLSYVFSVSQIQNRDDLFSLAVLLGKRDKVEIYKPALMELIRILSCNDALSEKTLLDNQQIIYEGINEEKDVIIENILIEFSKIFKEIKSKILKEKPQLKGSFL